MKVEEQIIGVVYILIYYKQIPSLFNEQNMKPTMANLEESWMDNLGKTS